MADQKNTTDTILSDATVDAQGVSVDTDKLEARLTEALANADLTEAAANATAPRDDSDLFAALEADLEDGEDNINF